MNLGRIPGKSRASSQHGSSRGETINLLIPESRRRRAVIRATAVGAVLLTLAYLTWRVISTLPGATPWLAIPMLVLEVHALLSLAVHVFDLWDLDPAPSAGRPAQSEFRVAVLVPTYNEPREILVPTLAAAVAVRPAHETWVLDDGHRPWVAELAEQLGVQYHARLAHEHAKAGNINSLLPKLDVDLIAVLDADHVTQSGFLEHVLGYFDDPRVALVQTPQDFYNVASFEHVATSKRSLGEQELFYRAVTAGRNRWNAAFWCGTNAVIRLAALRDVGGVATETVTEDIHTTIRLHRRGWRTVYHNEVLAQGLAAANSEQYLGQRLRWGTGAMQVLRTENPAFARGLTPTQRISYLSTLLGWFDSWRMLGLLLLPVATVLTGALPMAAPTQYFLPWFLSVFGAQQLALRLLARGHATMWHSTLFEVVRLPANLRATLTLLGRRQRAFTVTAKGRSSDGRIRMPAPRLLVALLAAHGVALAWYAASDLGHTPVHYPVRWMAHGAAAWLILNAAILTAAIGRIRSPRYGDERRAAVRFDIESVAKLDVSTVQICDVSLTGAAIVATAASWVPGQQVCVELSISGSVLRLPATVRTVRPLGGPDEGVQIGVEFTDLPASTSSALALALFKTGLTPHLVRIDDNMIAADDRRPVFAA
jgi:cellulose synthase (UDP-forming)